VFQAGNNVDLDAELPPNAIADLFRLSRRAVREAVNAGRVRSHGRRRKVLVVCEFLEDVEELDPCRADECHDPALADNGGCGKAGHGRRGRSPSAEAAKASRRALDEAIAVLGAEKLIDVAPDCGVHPGTAIRAAREGSLQSPFKGPQDVWVVRREDLQAELRQLKVDRPCKEPGCGGYVLLGEDYCYPHRGRGGRGKRTPKQKARMSAGALTRFEARTSATRWARRLADALRTVRCARPQRNDCRHCLGTSGTRSRTEPAGRSRRSLPISS
jgi:hypothetical protein